MGQEGPQRGTKPRVQFLLVPAASQWDSPRVRKQTRSVDFCSHRLSGSIEVQKINFCRNKRSRSPSTYPAHVGWTSWEILLSKRKILESAVHWSQQTPWLRQLVMWEPLSCVNGIPSAERGLLGCTLCSGADYISGLFGFSPEPVSPPCKPL